MMLGFVLLISHTAVAQQQFSVERITTREGLSNSTIVCMMQDSKGFMWFGTQDGLHKYDGHNFTRYVTDAKDTNTLSGNVIQSIVEDRNGEIWVATNHYGVNRYNRYTGKFKRYSHVANDPTTLTNNNVTCMVYDSSGGVWVGTRRGLNQYDRSKDRFIRHISKSNDESTISHDSISAMMVDKAGNLWATASGRYINRFLPTGRFQRVAVIPQSNVWMIVGFLCQDAKGNVCISYGDVRDNYGSLVDPKTNRVTRGYSKVETYFNRVNVVFHYLLPESENRLWMRVLPMFGSLSGLYIIEGGNRDDTASLSGILPDPLVKGSILCLYRDRTGVYWVGTDQGLVKLIPNSNEFNTIRADSSKRYSLTDNRIRSIHKDKSGILWVGTSEGLNAFDSKSQSVRHFYSKVGDADGLNSQTINTIYEDPDGTLHFGTNRGVNSIVNAARPFKRKYNIHGNMDDPIRPEAVWSLHRADDGRLWVGTKVDGVYIFDAEGKFERHLQHDPNDSTSLCDDNVWCITRDSRGNLWVGTNNGLNRWIPGENRFKQYHHNPSDPRSLCGNNIWWIYEDASKRLWIAAFGGGLSRYDRETDDFSSVTKNDGLPTNSVFGVLDDHLGRLWISTNAGLALYDPATRRVIRTYSEGDGLQSKEFSYKAMYKAPDGELFFGGMYGLSRFYPQNLRENKTLPPIAITSFRIFDSVERAEMFDGELIEVPYDQNFLSFEFAALDFTNPDKNQYAYRLENFDRDWVYCGSRRYVSYTNLDPGEYKFRVKGTNNDGLWNEQGATITLRILPPWWMTTWFRASAIAFGVLSISSLIYARIRAIRRKHALERKILESQLQALRSQMNPHFVFNSLNSIQYLILNSDEYSASDYLSKFARLVRIILDNSKYPSIPLDKELECLNVYLELEALRFEGQLEYVMDVDPTLQIDEYRIPSMLIQPYVENAIRHGLRHRSAGGRVIVRLRKREDTLDCMVEDNGVGRKRALELKRRSGIQHQSMAMSTTKERLDILNAGRQKDISLVITDLEDSHGEPLGTRVELCIPIEPTV